MQPHRLRHLPADAVQRVEARHRLLKDHARLAAAQLAQTPPPRIAVTSSPSISMRPEVIVASGRQQPQQRQARSATCRSRFRRPAPASRPASRVKDTSCTTARSPKETVSPSTATQTHRNPVFRGSKASRTASPMKISRISTPPEHDEGGDAQPGRLQIVLALRDQFAQRGRAGRQAEAQEVQARQDRHRARQGERQEGQRRHHRVGQDVAPHDRDIRHAERLGRAHVVESCGRAETPPAPRRSGSSS